MGNILATLQSFNQYHYSINNTVQNTNSLSEYLLNHSVKSALNIFLNVLETKDHAIFLLNYSLLKDLPSLIFDTMFVKNIRITTFEGESQDDLILLSKSVWERIVDNIDTKADVKRDLLHHVKKSITDVASVTR